MQAEENDGYVVLKVQEDLGADSNLSELRDAVSRYAAGGIKKIALHFTERTNFFSSTLSVLVQCLGTLKEQDGELSIIAPTESIMDTLRLTRLDSLIKTYESEEEIAKQ